MSEASCSSKLVQDPSSTSTKLGDSKTTEDVNDSKLISGQKNNCNSLKTDASEPFNDTTKNKKFQKEPSRSYQPLHDSLFSSSSNKSNQQYEQKCKLFIGGVPMSTTEEVLLQYFSVYGDVIDAVVMKDRSSGRSRGFGFVTFREPHMLDAAQLARPHEIEGKVVETKRAMPREDSANPESHITVYKLFVGGIKRDLSETDIQTYFSAFGNILECDLVRDRETGESRGFAFITFDDYDPVDQVLLSRPHTLGGKKVDVRKALSREQQFEFKQRQQLLNASRMPIHPAYSNTANSFAVALAAVNAAMQFAVRNPSLLTLTKENESFNNSAGNPIAGSESKGVSSQNKDMLSGPNPDVSSWAAIAALAYSMINACIINGHPQYLNNFPVNNPASYNGYTSNGNWIPPVSSESFLTGTTPSVVGLFDPYHGVCYQAPLTPAALSATGSDFGNVFSASSAHLFSTETADLHENENGKDDSTCDAKVEDQLS